MVLFPLTFCSQKGQALVSCSIPTPEGSLRPLSLWPRESCLPLPQQIVDCSNETIDSWQSRRVLAQDVSSRWTMCTVGWRLLLKSKPFSFWKGECLASQTCLYQWYEKELSESSPFATCCSATIMSSFQCYQVESWMRVMIKALHFKQCEDRWWCDLSSLEKVTGICQSASHDHQVTPTRPAPDGHQTKLQIASPPNGQELVGFWNRLEVTLAMWLRCEGGTEITHSPVADKRGQQSIVLSWCHGESYSR